MANGAASMSPFKWQRPATGIYRAGAGQFFSTIQAAINAAAADIGLAIIDTATVELYDAIYVENLTLSPKVNLKAMIEDCRVFGCHTYAGFTIAGLDSELVLDGVRFMAPVAGPDIFSFTGAAQTILRFQNCLFLNNKDDGTSTFKFTGGSNSFVTFNGCNLTMGSNNGSILDYSASTAASHNLNITNSRNDDAFTDVIGWTQQSTGANPTGRFIKGGASTSISARLNGLMYQGGGFPTTIEMWAGSIRILGGFYSSFGAAQFAEMNGGEVHLYGMGFDDAGVTGPRFLAAQGGTHGTDTITIQNNPNPGDTITFQFDSTPWGGIGIVTYGVFTFGAGPGQVPIGGTTAITAANLISAINAATNSIYLTAAPGGSANQVAVTSALRGASVNSYQIVSSSQGAGRVLVANLSLIGGSGGGGSVFCANLCGPGPGAVQYGITLVLEQINPAHV